LKQQKTTKTNNLIASIWKTETKTFKRQREKHHIIAQQK